MTFGAEASAVPSASLCSPHHASRCSPLSGRARELIDDDVERIKERLALHDRVEQSQCEVQRAGMGERVHE